MDNKEKKENDSLVIGIDGRVMQEKKPSGIPQYAIHTIREILKLDKKNKYIIFYNSFRDIKNNIPEFEGNVEKKFYRFPNKILEWVWKIFPYPKIDEVLNADIFFSPHFIKIPLSKKVKKIVTIHDLSFVRNKKYFSWRKNIWHWQMNPRKICAQSDKIIAVSEATKNDIKNIYKIDNQKIKVIYNGSLKIADVLPYSDEQAILDKFNLQKNSYVLFLATLEPRKNIEGIMEAFSIIEKKIPDIKLVVAGKKGWLFENIFERAKKHHIEEKIVFTDFVSEEEKYVLIKKSLLFIFPSFCEGFGLPIVEAINQGIPVITSSVSSMPEIAKDLAILVNPHNISDIAQSILQLVSNNELRNILKKKESSPLDLSWEKTARETLEYLTS